MKERPEDLQYALLTGESERPSEPRGDRPPPGHQPESELLARTLRPDGEGNDPELDLIALRDSLAEALGSSYELGALLGRGGMASVFRAVDRRLRRPVAIKVFTPGTRFSRELRARFLREAQTAAGLSHPHIVTVYDVGHEGELFWFVMAVVNGVSLGAHVKKHGRQSGSVARRVLMEVAQALAYAHARGVVHRDIKPDNILIDEATGRAMVADFGIARVEFDTDGAATLPGVVLGTTRYMAPEQALGSENLDGRADMYALGLVGCFLLTGHDALPVRNLPEAIAHHIRGGGVDLAELESQAPPEVIEALRRCLAHRPEDRYGRMEEFIEAMQQVGGELSEVPAGVRAFFRQSEQALIMTAITLIGLGLVGAERVSPAFVLLVLGASLGQWVVSLERARRVGMRWGAVRAAIHVERARRLEETRIQVLPVSGPVGVITLFGTCIGFVVLLARAGAAEANMLNRTLLLSGILGVFVAGQGLGIGPRRRSAFRYRYAALVTGFVVFAGLYLRTMRTGEEYWAPRFIFTLSTAAVSTFVLLVLRLRPKPANPEAGSAPEWEIPRWLDWAGSLLFGRIVRRDGRLVFERETLHGR